jgi:hypothetical protein
MRHDQPHELLLDMLETAAGPGAAERGEYDPRKSGTATTERPNHIEIVQGILGAFGLEPITENSDRLVVRRIGVCSAGVGRTIGAGFALSPASSAGDSPRVGRSSGCTEHAAATRRRCTRVIALRPARLFQVSARTARTSISATRSRLPSRLRGSDRDNHGAFTCLIPTC